ncbi:MAG: M20/M25/M40 family metallo-hydrolase [Ardenticatenaceae bacterium]|nr:M20/M25/M40 family metallo-hydrolase [Ardenticatenaceae bacterium]
MVQQGLLEGFLREREPFYLGLLERMVGINSFTANAAGVNRLGEETAVIFADLGFTAETIQSTTPHYGKHLVLSRAGSSGRKLGLISHLDTVFPPEEEAANDFYYRIEGDRIYGPGSADIKGGTVMIYMVLDGLRRFVPEFFEAMNWVILLDASEEAEAEDFGRLCAERLAGSLGGLIFESGEMRGNQFRLVRARKGLASFRVQVQGKAAHAGNAHHRGANAIVQLAEIIQQLAALTDYERQLTVNVGWVAGGTVTNRVPHEAEARLEMRAFSVAAFEETIETIMGFNGRSTLHSREGYPCQVTVTLTEKTSPWQPNKATDRLVAYWQQAAALLGQEIVPEERGGLSDANHFWREVACLDGLGPAGANDHCSERSADGTKEQEYSVLSSYVPKAVLNITAVLLLAQE